MPKVTLRSELDRDLSPPEADDNFALLHGPPSYVVLSGDILTVEGEGWYVIDTEGAAAADVLVRISGVPIGGVIRVSSADATRIITVTPSAYLHMASDGTSGVPFTLESPWDYMTFLSHGSDVCGEYGRHHNAA